MSDEINAYAAARTTPPDELLGEILTVTQDTRSDAGMLSGAYQGRLLTLISQMLQPRRILEIGTYMGYSALCLAEGLSSDGKLITLDVNAETQSAAQAFWTRSPLNDKIEARLGDATEIIPTLDETFDLVFIDADKPNYARYYDLALDKLRVGGCILADNVLWSGKVLDAERGDAEVDRNTQALHEFNNRVEADERVTQILLTIRDGLLLIRKTR